MIEIKDIDIFKSLLENTFHHNLFEIVTDLINAINYYKVAACITSAVRTDNPDSTHFYGRALDFRTYLLHDDQVHTILYLINFKWIYDPSRPKMECLIYHDIGQGEHFHLQVCDKTEKRIKREEA